MARFPYQNKNIVPLGRLLAKARMDPIFRKRLINNPKEELAKVGLPENVVELITFKVVDPADEKVVALPFRLNQQKLDNRNKVYLEAIAGAFN